MLLAVSVDLDETHHYRDIHGLESRGVGREVYARALPRLSDWARQRGIPLTWFVVGKDVDGDPANAESVGRLASLGDELGCHTYSHHYDLTQRPFTELEREVVEGARVVERCAGVRVTGFRAPGYLVTDSLLDLLRELGFAYDSSIFPCPAYYALKAVVVAAVAAGRRESRAIVGAPEVLRAPTQPYRVGRPHWFRGNGIWEIPIQVTPRARLPFIGTALTLAGTMGARLLASRLVGEPFLNLELHGIDALDERDGLGDLAGRQRDLRIPWNRKLDTIDAAIGLLQRKGYRCVRMDELAAAAKAA